MAIYVNDALQDPPPSVDYPYRPPRIDDVLYQAVLPEGPQPSQAGVADEWAAPELSTEDAKKKRKSAAKVAGNWAVFL